MLLNALRPHGGPHSLRLFCRCNWPTLRCLLFDLFDLFHNVQGQARCGRATVKLGELRKLIRKVLQRFLSAFHSRDPSPSQLVLARQRQKAHGGGHQRATLRSIERKCKVHFVSLRVTSNLCFFKYFSFLWRLQRLLDVLRGTHHVHHLRCFVQRMAAMPRGCQRCAACPPRTSAGRPLQTQRASRPSPQFQKASLHPLIDLRPTLVYHI